MPHTSPGAVLHYVGYDVDHGGILAVIRALAAEQRFPCVLGVNPAFQVGRSRDLEILRLSNVSGDTISLRNMLRAHRVAREVQVWLRGDVTRVFHGHSRAGLLVALWLRRFGEKRAVATVHCYGRQRWFYRWAARYLRGRIFWLSPEMTRYYGLQRESGAGDRWMDCLPGCVPALVPIERRPLQRDPIHLAGVGAITRWKRWDLVVDALVSLPEELRMKFRFRHIGGTDGSADAKIYADELRRKTAEHELGLVVEWRGEQPSADPLLAESDYLIVASHCEPLSIAMLEALLAGVPVLAAASGGALDLISPPVNGRLFSDGDPEGLAGVLTELAGGGRAAPAPMDRDGLRRFTAENCAARHAEIYRGLPTT